MVNNSVQNWHTFLSGLIAKVPYSYSPVQTNITSDLLFDWLQSTQATSKKKICEKKPSSTVIFKRNTLHKVIFCLSRFWIKLFDYGNIYIQGLCWHPKGWSHRWSGDDRSLLKQISMFIISLWCYATELKIENMVSYETSISNVAHSFGSISYRNLVLIRIQSFTFV